VLDAGDLFLMPARVPHSPRRREGSWTFVIERKRTQEEKDLFIWVCEQCQKSLYETDVRFDDPSDAVVKASEEMRRDKNLATCNSCGAVLEL
jgi:3-hydroxyanthranilate 3,4-dioxygenase